MDSKVLIDLCESYSSIYEPEVELTEEDIWEEVEDWVDSLLDEGYDLSEYTWEEMYEAYLEEVWGPQRYQRTGQSLSSRVSGALGFGNNKPVDRSKGIWGTGKKPSSPKPAPKPATTPTSSKPAAAPVASGGASRPPAAAPAPKPTAKPAASVPSGAKVAPTAAAKPAGQTGDRTKDMATWAKSNPTLANKPKTFNPLMQRTFGYQTGGAPDQAAARVASGKVDSTEIRRRAAVASTRTATESAEWGSTSKLVDEIANLYQSVYEAKKVDQDQDGDNDFADIRIARMIASGVPKEEAIRRVREKSYNEEFELDEAAKRTPRKVRGSKNETEYMAGRSDAGKRISGDEDTGPVYYTYGRARGARPDTPTRPGKKPKNTPRVSKRELEYARMRHKSASGKDWNRFGGLKGLPEDFELWINELLDEGYDLSDYTLDEMYEYYLDEETAKEKEERIAARRARVKEMQSQGRVMTSSKRASARAKERKEEQRLERLERAANAVIAQERGASGRSGRVMGTEGPKPKEKAPEATRRLRAGLKRDTLGSAADEVLRAIRNEEFELWVETLIDEGYDLSDYTWDELYEAYLEY